MVQSDVASVSGVKNYSGYGLFRQYSILFQLSDKNGTEVVAGFFLVHTAS